MNLRKVTPGQKLRISADTWNTMVDAARDFQRRSLRQGAVQTPDARSTGVVLLRNDSGQDCYRCDVLGLDNQAVIVDPEDNEQEFLQRIVLAGVTPAAEHVDSYGILQEPIKDGKLGRAMLVGVTQAWVDIKSESDTHAAPAQGTTANLVSATGGIARILWKQLGTGVKLTILRLGGGGGGGGSNYPACTVICIEAIPANSLARILSYNRHSDTYLVAKPEANDLPLSQLVWIPEAIEANTPGTGMLDFGAAPLLTDDDVKPGDTVGSRAGSWKARKGLVGLEVAAVISGTLSYVNILDGGSGYIAPPTLTFSGGSATRQATVLCKIADGKLSAVIVLDSGAGYLSAPTPTLSGNATVEAVLVSAIDALALGDGGAGYAANASYALTFTPTNGGTGAAGYADSNDDGVIYRLRLTARGFGHLAAPTVTVPNPPGYPGDGKAIATATASVA